MWFRPAISASLGNLLGKQTILSISQLCQIRTCVLAGSPDVCMPIWVWKIPTQPGVLSLDVWQDKEESECLLPEHPPCLELSEIPSLLARCSALEVKDVWSSLLISLLSSFPHFCFSFCFHCSLTWTGSFKTPKDYFFNLVTFHCEIISGSWKGKCGLGIWFHR